MVLDVVIEGPPIQDFIDIVAVNEDFDACSTCFVQYLPVVVIVIKSCLACYGVDFSYPSAEGIVCEFGYIVAVFGDFNDAALIVIFVFVACLSHLALLAAAKLVF